MGIRQFLDIGTGIPTAGNAHEVEAFFEGLDLVEPGVVPVGAWRPDQEGKVKPLNIYAGVGRKP